MAETALHDHPLTDPPIADNAVSKPIHLRGIAHRITPANARAMALRSAQAKRAKHLPPVTDPLADDDSHAHAIKTVLKQIDAVDKALGRARKASDWRDLTMAKERLFKQWTHLAGIAGPGNFKPRSARSRQASIPDPIPLPEPNQAAS